ncbi:unnamed protein product [Rhodiola kirilowii]
MGRKGSWLAAIKKAFIPKEKQSNEFSEKRSRQAKASLGKQKHREGGSFIPLFRQPSSIEKILGEVEREHHNVLNRPPSEQPRQQAYVPPRATSSRPNSLRIGSPRAPSPKASSSRVISTSIALPRTSSSKTSLHNKPTTRYRPEPTLAYQHVSATKIQAVYRGYTARRSFRALKGLVRLQGVVRGQNVQRQTMNAMKQMQLMVRIQTQIQSRRIQLLENQSLHRHNQYKNHNDTFTEGILASESGNADWEDSMLTKEEIEARMQKKMEAAIKRERAMAYAYSHTLLKGTQMSSQDNFMDHRSGSFPWWWNWLERRLPSTKPHESPYLKTSNHPTPARSFLQNRLSPHPQSRNYKQHAFESEAHESLTPRSTKSSFIPRWKPSHTPTRTVSQAPTPGRALQLNTPNRTSSGRQTTKHSKPKPTGVESPLVKDDDSLNSCPQFSAPSYMAPTASAKAKVRAGSTLTEETDATPGRRFTFPLSQGIGSFKWNKGSSLFLNKEAKNDHSERKLEKDESFHSAGNLSVDSTTSLPVEVGRKPFNRFV